MEITYSLTALQNRQICLILGLIYGMGWHYWQTYNINIFRHALVCLKSHFSVLWFSGVVSELIHFSVVTNHLYGYILTPVSMENIWNVFHTNWCENVAVYRIGLILHLKIFIEMHVRRAVSLNSFSTSFGNEINNSGLGVLMTDCYTTIKLSDAFIPHEIWLLTCFTATRKMIFNLPRKKP